MSSSFVSSTVSIRGVLETHSSDQVSPAEIPPCPPKAGYQAPSPRSVVFSPALSSGSSASCGPIHMLLCPEGSPSAARGSPQTLSDHSPQSKSTPHYIPLSCFCLSFLTFIMSYPAFINAISCLLCTPPSTLQAPKTTERVCPISHCVFCADLSSINTGWMNKTKYDLQDQRQPADEPTWAPSTAARTTPKLPREGGADLRESLIL